MNFREEQEKKEYTFLSEFATKSCESKGRKREEKPCDIRTCFARDRDRILHCKSFRRLKQKTQVFLAPIGDHYRTRLVHTLEVSQIGRTIGKALGLNETLIEAIALGHDLGHTPFGHIGERALNEICPYGFKHNEQSIRIVEELEEDGKGLNLTYEVRDGILNHKTSLMPNTLEGKVIRLADKMAYLHHDMDDALRCKMVTEEDIPISIKEILGNSLKKRLDVLVHDVINNSYKKPDIVMSSEVEKAMLDFRDFMFERVYKNPETIAEEQKAGEMVKSLYIYFDKHIDELPVTYKKLIETGEKKERVVCDYISGMADSYAVMTFKRLYIPNVWEKE